MVWLECDEPALGLGALDGALVIVVAGELRPLLLAPMVNGEDGLPKLELDELLLPVEARDDRPTLLASWIAPSPVLSERPFSFVTEPGFARVPDDDERVLTTIERPAWDEDREAEPELPRSPAGVARGGKASTEDRPREDSLRAGRQRTVGCGETDSPPRRTVVVRSWRLATLGVPRSPPRSELGVRVGIVPSGDRAPVESGDPAADPRRSKLRLGVCAEARRWRASVGFLKGLGPLSQSFQSSSQSHHQGSQSQLDPQNELAHHGLQKPFQPHPPQLQPPQPQPQPKPKFQHDELQPSHQPLWHQPSDHHHGFQTYTTEG